MLEVIEWVLRLMTKMLRRQVQKDQQGLENINAAQEALMSERTEIASRKVRCERVAKRIQELTEGRL